MTRALITGISGFTGRHLAVELADAGYQVVGLTQTGGGAGPEALACDLTDAGALSAAVLRLSPEVVVHLAGVTFVPPDGAEAFYRINVVGTRNLLSALTLLPNRPRAVLLASSATVYGSAGGGVLDESIAPAPANDYAVSKLAMEHMALLWQRYLPITIVRPFNYTGVGQTIDFVLPKIVSHFQRRAAVLELGSLDVERDFSDVRTVVRCYRRLLDLQNDTLGRGVVLNVCSGRGHSLRDVLSMASGLTGFMPRVTSNPSLVRENEVKRLVGSRAALEQWIGPVADVPLLETLRWMLDAA
jgi:nucleoside-diphosphate-sugar epimerase